MAVDPNSQKSQIPYIEREAAEQFLADLGQALEPDSESPKSTVFNIWGIGGVGKSTLLKKITEAFADKADCAQAFFGLTEGIENPLGLMARLFEDLEKADDWGFKSEFSKLYQRYKGTLNKLKTEPLKGRQVDENQIKQVQTLMNLGVGLIQKGMPEESAEAWGSVGRHAVSGAVAMLSVKDEVGDLLRSHKATRKDRELQELMLDPLPKLTEAFAKSLRERAQQRPVVLMLDTYEKAPLEIDDWLGRSLVGNQELGNTRIVVAGRNRLVDREDWRKLRQDRDCLVETGLERFDLEQTQTYLHRIGMTDDAVVEQVQGVTKGLPYYLDWIRRERLRGQDLDFSEGNEEIVRLLLQGLNRTQRRVVELAACCRRFNRGLIEFLVGSQGLEFSTAVDESLDCFEWLKRQDFVERVGRFQRLDDVARDVFRQSLLEADERLFATVQGALADYFLARSNEVVGVEESPRLKYENEDWRRERSEYLYHLLLSRRKEIQIEFRSHLLEARYFGKPSMTREPFEALIGEFELAEHPLLEGDAGTRRFLKLIEPAVQYSWTVLEEVPLDYKKCQEKYGYSRQQVNDAWGKVLEKPDKLSGLVEFSAYILKSGRGLESQKINYLRKAQALADDLIIESDPKFSSELFLWKVSKSIILNFEDYEQALLFIDRSLEIEPENQDSYYIQGLLLKELGKKEEAIESYDKALEIKPDLHEAWFNRGVSLSDLGKKEEAIESYDKALEIKPDKHEAWFNRANSLSDLGKKEEAIESYDKALEIKPDKHGAWFNRANSLYDLGKKEEAIESYDKALEIKPDLHEAWFNRGVSLSDLGKKEEEIESYDKALEIKPDKHEAWFNRANSLSDLGKKEEAIESYDKALEIKPDKHNALASRGDVYRQLEKYEQAIADLDRAIELKPDYAWAIATRGQIYAQMQQYEKALADFDQAIEIDPDYRWAIAYRGDIYRKLGRHEQALADLNRALELKRDYTWAIATRGQTYAQMQQYEKALQDLDRAIEIDPEYTLAIGKRGEIDLYLHRYTEALEIFNQILEKEPDEDYAFYLRALALAKTPGVCENPEAETQIPLNTPGVCAPAQADLIQAIHLAQTAQEKDPEDWRNNFNLALYHLAAGHHPQAQTQYQTTLTTAPTWAIREAHRDLRDYLQLFPEDQAAKEWWEKLGKIIEEKEAES